MKEEVIKEIIELERDKILSQFREYFGVTDPKFQPISVSQDSDPSKLIINGPNINIKIRGTTKITDTILTLFGILEIAPLISKICLSRKKSI